MAKDKKMTYCFDVDGTICTLTTNHEFHKAKPIPSMVKKINRLYKQGHIIKIATARGHLNADGVPECMEYHELTIDQLDKWGVNYDEIHFKPLADFYIDDLAMTPEEFINAYEP